MKLTRSLAVVGLLFALAGCTARTQSDPTITAQVQEKLRKEGLPPTIVVRTASAVVTLDGSVPDADARTHAAAVAADVTGVHQVINNLQTTRAADAPSQPRVAPPVGGPIPPAPGAAPEAAPNVPQDQPGDVPAHPPQANSNPMP